MNPIFSPRERKILATIAETTVPGSEKLPRAGARTVEQVEEFLSVVPPLFQGGFKAALWLLELHTLPRSLRPLSAMSDEARLRALEGLVNGSFPERQLLRVITATLKAAHFHDPAVYAALGATFQVEPPVSFEVPRWTELIMDGGEVTSDEELECDVVVVGSGAGGAAAAKTLAEAGLAVVILEEGAYYDRRHFTGNTIAMQRLMYRDLGGVMALGNVPIIVPIGRAVGGTTVINSGTCLPPPAEVLRSWEREHGLSHFSPERFLPYVERVQEFLEVGPSEAKHIGDVGRVIAKGCDALGLAHGPLPRNAPGCDAQARCAFGCPTDAKKSTNVSFIPAALRANAFLYTRTTAEAVLIDEGRAAGIIARTRGGARLTLRSRATVLAMGALLTPPFLLRHRLGNRSLQVGRNLTIHPAMGMAAEMDHPTDGFRSVPQGYAIEGFFNERLLFEGGTAPPDLMVASTHEVGPRFMSFADRMDHMVLFGFAVKDTSHGQVFQGPAGRPLITYFLNREDRERIRRGVEILTRVFFAGGARRVFLPIRGFELFESEADLERFLRSPFKPRDLDLTAYHPLGTTRLGVDPRRSVVGPSHELHDLPGLFICDGGAIPSSLGVNPQITIMAMATRAGELLAEKLS